MNFPREGERRVSLAKFQCFDISPFSVRQVIITHTLDSGSKLEYREETPKQKGACANSVHNGAKVQIKYPPLRWKANMITTKPLWLLCAIVSTVWTEICILDVIKV